MKRSRLVLLLTGLAVLIGAAAISSAPRASASDPPPKLMFRPSQVSVGIVHVGFTVTAEPVSVFNSSGLVAAPIANSRLTEMTLQSIGISGRERSVRAGPPDSGSIPRH